MKIRSLFCGLKSRVSASVGHGDFARQMPGECQRKACATLLCELRMGARMVFGKKSIRRLRRFASVIAGPRGAALFAALFGPITALTAPAGHRSSELPVPAGGNTGFTQLPPAGA